MFNNIISLISLKLGINNTDIKFNEEKDNYYSFIYKNYIIKYFKNNDYIFYQLNRTKFIEYYGIIIIQDNIVMLPFAKETKVVSSFEISNTEKIIKRIFNINLKLNIRYISENKYYNDDEIIEAIKYKHCLLQCEQLKKLRLNKDYFYNLGISVCNQDFINSGELFNDIKFKVKGLINKLGLENKKVKFADKDKVVELDLTDPAEVEELPNKEPESNIKII